MIEDNTVFTLIMIDACHSKKINNLLKKEKIAFTVYGCVDMKINSIFPFKSHQSGEEVDDSKYHLQGDQLILKHAESVDNGHFSCILMKTSTGEFLETSSAQLVVKNCEAKPCKNGGTCVEMVKGKVKSV